MNEPSQTNVVPKIYRDLSALEVYNTMSFCNLFTVKCLFSYLSTSGTIYMFARWIVKPRKWVCLKLHFDIALDSLEMRIGHMNYLSMCLKNFDQNISVHICLKNSFSAEHKLPTQSALNRSMKITVWTQKDWWADDYYYSATANQDVENLVHGFC